MRTTRYALFGFLLSVSPIVGAQEQDSAGAVVSPDSTGGGPGIQANAAYNKKLRERELQSAVQKAREMRALKNAIAAAPMAPIPYTPPPETEPEPAPTSPPPSSGEGYGPPPVPSSPNAGDVQNALMEATNRAPDVELPSSGRNRSGGLLGKLLGKDDESGGVPDAPTFDSPPPSYQPPPSSPYEGETVEPMNEAPASAPSADERDAPIFVKRNQGDSGRSGTIKAEVEIDIEGVDVILPQGSSVTILEERDGFARVRIPDGRTGIVDRSAIE